MKQRSFFVASAVLGSLGIAALISADNPSLAGTALTTGGAGKAGGSGDKREAESTPSEDRSEPGVLAGDASLRGEFDVAAIERSDDRYVAPLPRQRTATLTLDPSVQNSAEAVLERARVEVGAVVVMSVDGRILALAGRRDGRPDVQSATEVWAPAASVFKVVTAAALVDAGVRPDAQVCYHDGVRSVIASNLADDPERDRQCQDLSYAVARSQNAIIAKLAHRHLDRRALRRAASAFGFDDTLDFALDVEPGRADIPADELAFARVSAGFWQTELSPIGGAVLAGTVATGGLAITPRIVDRIQGPSGIVEVRPVEPRRVVPEHVARDVAHMMTGTTGWGTARTGFHDLAGRPFFPRFEVAGKTGTLTRTAPSYLEYSWFVGFAPADEPRVVVSVLLGNPQKWHLKAHTAARIVLQSAL